MEALKIMITNKQIFNFMVDIIPGITETNKFLLRTNFR